MVFTGLNFVAVTVLVRQMGTDLPAVQSAFLRFAIGTLFLIPSFYALLRRRIANGMMPFFLGRGVMHSAGVVLWFYAMARIPVAEVTAIGYLNPVLVIIGAGIFFKEKVAWWRYVAIGLALSGALIILRPGFRELGPGQLAQVVSAMFLAGSYLFGKRLSQTVSAGNVVVMLSFCVTLGLAPLAYVVWVAPTLWQLLSLTLVAGFATVGHFSMTRAFQSAPMAVTQPVAFLQLIWASAFGYVLFEESPDVFVLIGGFVIIASVTFIAWRSNVNT
ncbi:MAG: DMT family transporter [Paracoccaceae bacterium]